MSERQDKQGKPLHVHCPNCGSEDVRLVSSFGYNWGCGCLGWLLFNWIGLLLGLLDSTNYENVCANCGYHWQPGKKETGWGCCGCLVLVFLAYILWRFFLFFLCFL